MDLIYNSHQIDLLVEHPQTIKKQKGSVKEGQVIMGSVIDVKQTKTRDFRHTQIVMAHGNINAPSEARITNEQ